jgi:hypothetical protein
MTCIVLSMPDGALLEGWPATIGGCAGFAAISGDSLSTAVTMGTVVLPEMSIQVLPSWLPAVSRPAPWCPNSAGIVFIIYGMLTEQSIDGFYLGDFQNSCLRLLCCSSAWCRLDPTLGPLTQTTFLEDGFPQSYGGSSFCLGWSSEDLSRCVHGH